MMVELQKMNKGINALCLHNDKIEQIIRSWLIFKDSMKPEANDDNK